MSKKSPEAMLRDAVRRLDKSRTCLTRARARSNLSAVLGRIETRLLESYRPIDLAGNEAPKRKSRGFQCPICGVPMRSSVCLATHLAKAHQWMRFSGSETNITCICGKEFWEQGTGDLSRMRVTTKLMFHLRKLHDMVEHFSVGALRQIGD